MISTADLSALLCLSVAVVSMSCSEAQSAAEIGGLDHVSANVSPLIAAEDCMAGSAAGKVGICHRTNGSSAYVHLRVSTQGCVNGHANHVGDFVSDDPSCATCVPTTCAAQGKNCGTMPDGCGGELECGTCLGGQFCGGSGAPNVCAAPCSPLLPQDPVTGQIPSPQGPPFFFVIPENGNFETGNLSGWIPIGPSTAEHAAIEYSQAPGPFLTIQPITPPIGGGSRCGYVRSGSATPVGFNQVIAWAGGATAFYYHVDFTVREVQIPGDPRASQTVKLFISGIEVESRTYESLTSVSDSFSGQRFPAEAGQYFNGTNFSVCVLAIRDTHYATGWGQACFDNVGLNFE